MSNEWRERRLYVFTCHACGKIKRRTVKRKRARLATCLTCTRKEQRNKNQLALFPNSQPTQPHDGLPTASPAIG